MLDSQFRELVGQYLDGEISPADRALLNEEVRSFPRRKREFLEYTQLNRACRAAFGLDSEEQKVQGSNGLEGVFLGVSAWRRFLFRWLLAGATFALSLWAGFALFYQFSLREEGTLQELGNLAHRAGFGNQLDSNSSFPSMEWLRLGGSSGESELAFEMSSPAERRSFGASPITTTSLTRGRNSDFGSIPVSGSVLEGQRDRPYAASYLLAR